ncbi:MAG: polysulfide reductase NrfD [Chloroflexi bacterium]|nr:polysulfide reductase NrfD [Chloroflexota bacterium]
MAPKTENLLRVMTKTSGGFYLLLMLALAVLAWFLYAWAFKLTHGEIVLGLRDWGPGGGVTWGLYIGMFIWWVGIAHGGILVSAAVRLFKVKSLAPVARLAELMALVALPLAVTGILMQLGRLDRVATSIIPIYPRAIQHSPLMWDVTVITLYFVLTGTYILLTLRHDVHVLRHRLPRLLSPLYRGLTIGYQPEEDEKVERMVWWLALGLIILAPLLLHGGVIPWLFALLPSMPGFYSAVMGPVFLSLAIVSAFGVVSIIAYVFRCVHKWRDIFPDSVFAALGSAMLFSALAALWLQLQLNIGGLFAPPLGVEKTTTAKLETPAYWLAIGLIAATLFYLAAQRFFPRLFSAAGTMVAGLLVVIAVFVEKTLFVVEGLMHPAFGLYEEGSYFPSWVEISGVVGTIFIVILAFTVLVKVIPVIEVRVLEES